MIHRQPYLKKTEPSKLEPPKVSDNVDPYEPPLNYLKSQQNARRRWRRHQVTHKPKAVTDSTKDSSSPLFVPDKSEPSKLESRLDSDYLFDPYQHPPLKSPLPLGHRQFLSTPQALTKKSQLRKPADSEENKRQRNIYLKVARDGLLAAEFRLCPETTIGKLKMRLSRMPLQEPFITSMKIFFFRKEIDPRIVELTWCGKRLSDLSTIAECGLQDDDILEVTILPA
jgi:hypothetical protein